MSRLRWFPKQGDLVAIPVHTTHEKGITGKCTYGVVIRESTNSSFKGAWWDIFCNGIIASINIQTISPLWDKEGICLMTNCGLAK